MCRRSWKRICGSPARLSKGLKRCVVMSRRSSGSPALGGEYEAVLAPQGAGPVYLLQLTLQVASEGFQGRLRESHGAAAALGLRRGKDRAALRGGQGAPHLQSPGLKVNVVPLEPEQLSLPQPGGNGQDVEGFEAVALRAPRTASLTCSGGQRSHLFPAYLRRLDGLGGVARDKAVRDGLLERLVERDVDVLDGARRESGIKLLAVESAHVGRGQRS